MVLQLITLLQRQPTYTVASYMHSNSVLNTCIPNISLLSRVSSLHCCIGFYLGHSPGADLLGAILIMVLSRHVPGTRPRSTTSTTKANCVKLLRNSWRWCSSKSGVRKMPCMCFHVLQHSSVSSNCNVGWAPRSWLMHVRICTWT